MSELSQRYGPPPDPARRRRGIIAVSGLAAASLTWIIWAGLKQSQQEIYWTQVGFTIRSDAQVDVTYDVGRPTGTDVTCQLQALDARKGVVGLREVRIEPSDRKVTRRTDSVKTSAKAVTGFAQSCS